MSPALQIAHARRKTARVVLIMVIAIMTALVLFGGGPVGLVTAEAQQTTPGVSIKFVNPDADGAGPGAEISDVEDGEGTRYHIVAWVNQNPTNPIVEFQFQAGTTGNFQTIGNGTQVDANTWELFWDGTGMPADPAAAPGTTTGTLRVNLYSGTGSGPVSQDNETVRVNRTAPASSTPQDSDVPNAAEITYPVNGGVIGFFRAADGYQGQIQVEASDNTGDVLAYYTTTAYGSDPTWTECNAGETEDDAESDGVTCTLQGDDTPEQVRAVAVKTQDANQFAPPNFTDNDSGDAHKATGYVQDPTTITVDNAQGQQQQSISSPQGAPPNTFPCSNVIEVQVFDQQSRPVFGANVDVHAQGPSDGTQFDDSGDSSSPHQPPDRGGHGTEATANCEQPTGPPILNGTGNQGDHDLGGNDIKHIESSSGTDEEGKFRFALIGRQSGTTQWTAWVDKDDSDTFCAQEPNVDGSMGWGVSAPAITGVDADQATCPTPSPPTPSPSTTSPSPSPSTTSPSPSPSTSSPSPTPTDPPETRTFATNVSIDHDRRPSDFEGKVRSQENSCEPGRKIVVKKKRSGRDKTVGSDTTNRQGEYRIVVRRARGKYYAIAKRDSHPGPGNDTTVCQRGKSKTIRARR